MPTGNRKWYVNKAIELFNAQDYPNKELIIVYNHPSDIPDELMQAENIQWLKTETTSIGSKRNAGCSYARGSIIAQWDDDDIYHPTRLSVQAAPIIAGIADITALQHMLFYEHDTGKTWSCTPELFATLFAKQVAGGTLVYQKKIWDRLARYQPINLREDAEFLIDAIHKGARLKPIQGKGIFIYRRHSRNTWRFNPILQIGQPGWKEEDFPAWATTVLTESNPNNYSNLPMVSCIMPTADRNEYIPKAIEYFLDQTYANRELIILDDGMFPVSAMIPFHPQIRYIRQTTKSTIGTKRNTACRLSHGEIIMHWDDDDWYAHDWISEQVAFMQRTDADISGLMEVIFYQPAKNKAWKYVYPHASPAWVAGATLAYKKYIWEAHPFKEIQVGEDNYFVWQSAGKVIPHTYLHGFVSHIHAGNTSPKHTHDPRWLEFPTDEVKKILHTSHPCLPTSA
jgi:glycosyltransferase involved in cell wall biosynthesis